MGVVSAFPACGAPDVELPGDTTREEASVVTRDAASPTAECDQAPDGTPCGDDGGAVRHCLFNACVLNVCGDGVEASDEVCDDGNQEDRDGCNSRCEEPRCGNGLVDGREQCDDGNTSDGDACDTMCRPTTRVPDAGGGAQDAATDAGGAGDGGVMDAEGAPSDTGVPVADTGEGEVDASSPDAGTPDGGGARSNDAAVCGACVVALTSPCRDWYGYELVAGCFNHPDPVAVTRCVALYRCAMNDPGGCAAHATGVAKCYCGTVDIDNGACFLESAQPDGPCVQEVYAASNCSTPRCVETDLVIEDTASFWAQYLTLCSVNSDGCQAACPLPIEVPAGGFSTPDAGPLAPAN